LITVVELFCKSEKAGLKSYERKYERIEPILWKEPASGESAWHPPVVRTLIKEFMDNLLLRPDWVKLEADMREAVNKILGKFWLNPAHDEVKAFGSCRYEHGFDPESYSYPLARRFQWIDLLRILRYRKFKPLPAFSWEKGSYVITPVPLRFLIKIALFLRRSTKPPQQCTDTRRDNTAVKKHAPLRTLRD